MQGGKVEFLPDLFKHSRVFFGIRIHVLIQNMGIRIHGALQLLDDPPGDELTL